MPSFFSPRSYRHGSVGAALALLYVGVAALLVISAAAEAAAAGTSTDGSFFFGFALLATLPLSAAVLMINSAVLTSQGVPLADQDVAVWMYGAFAACGVVNALAIWMIFRGGRIRPPVEPDVPLASWD